MAAKGRKRNINNKDRREYAKLYSDVWIATEEKSPKCPYCGGKMILRDSSYVHSKHSEMLYVCENYPSCDCYCRTRLNNRGKRILISTPADKKLREFRREAHYYFDAVMNAGIYTDKTDLYNLLSSRIILKDGQILHIGECREYGCGQIIRECVNILYQNKDRVKPFRRWNNSKNETKEISDMLDEITYR